jgi:hypothetical protein
MTRFKITVEGSAIMLDRVIKIRLDDEKKRDVKVFLYKSDLLELMYGKRHRIRVFRDYELG